MRKKAVIVICTLVFGIFGVFLLSGGKDLGAILIYALRQDKKTGAAFVREFVEGTVVRDEVVSMKGVWIGMAGDKMAVWTLSGPKVFKVKSDAKMFFDDKCSDKVSGEKVLFGYTGSMGRYVSKNELLGNISMGKVVGFSFSAGSRVVENIDYTNAAYLSFDVSKEGVCDEK